MSVVMPAGPIARERQFEPAGCLLEWQIAQFRMNTLLPFAATRLRARSAFPSGACTSFIGAVTVSPDVLFR